MGKIQVVFSYRCVTSMHSGLDVSNCNALQRAYEQTTLISDAADLFLTPSTVKAPNLSGRQAPQTLSCRWINYESMWVFFSLFFFFLGKGGGGAESRFTFGIMNLNTQGKTTTTMTKKTLFTHTAAESEMNQDKSTLCPQKIRFCWLLLNHSAKCV